MLPDRTFLAYLEELSSGSPSPGGGSVAALSGALGAALVSMVCNLTLDDPAYEDVHAEIAQILASSTTLRKRLIELAEEDARITAWLIPVIHELKRAAGAEREALHRQAQAGLVAAAKTPLAILEGCCQVLESGRRVAEIGNAVALSDTGMAVAAADAGIAGAALTVRINLAAIENRVFVETAADRVAQLCSGCRDLRDAVLTDLHRRLEIAS